MTFIERRTHHILQLYRTYYRTCKRPCIKDLLSYSGIFSILAFPRAMATNRPEVSLIIDLGQTEV